MSTTEHTINDAIADILRTTRHCWRATHYVRSENTRAISGSAKRPDIIVAEVNVSPVVIEVEVMPAVNVEIEAKSRLGERLTANGRTIMSSVAVRVADSHRLLVGKALRTALEADQAIEYALFTGDNPIGATRWPAKGWLRGSLADLSLLTQSAGVPPEVIEQAADRLVAGVGEAAGLLNEVATTHPAVLTTIASALCQEDAEQTRRMATTILANAFVFHESLSHGPGGLATVLTLDEMRVANLLTRGGVLEQWEKILAVNYWPIFDIAKRILAPIPTDTARLMIDSLSRTASPSYSSPFLKGERYAKIMRYEQYWLCDPLTG